jgi:hypothetical protein
MSQRRLPFRVFFAWQSDTAEDDGHYLIRDALYAAAETLNAEASSPYEVIIDHDTKDEPGLCDIPKVILEKIDLADAFVADLTYIASRQAIGNRDAKHCSNPNVLFELGFAFRSMTDKRLVCIMDEAHGPKTGQIFDLSHRRFPIPYTSGGASDRKQNKKKLTGALAKALRPIVQLGPRSIAGDEPERHAEDRVMIEAQAQSKTRAHDMATITFYMHPLRYEERRWENSERLLDVIRRRTVHKQGDKTPLQSEDAYATEWGLFCKPDLVNQERWAITYAGQFWCQFSWKHNSMTGVFKRSGGSDPASFDSVSMLEDTVGALGFFASLAHEYRSGETVEIVARGSNFDNKLTQSLSSRAVLRGPSQSATFNCRFKLSNTEFATSWQLKCQETLHDAFGLFGNVGDRFASQNSHIDKMVAESSRGMKIPNPEED